MRRRTHDEAPLPETICLLCRRSCGLNLCSWADRLEPVDGWTAVMTNNGHCVTACPGYARETPESILPQRIDTDGMLCLLDALVRQMRDDYIEGAGRYTANDIHKHLLQPEDQARLRKMNRDYIEKWIKTGQGRLLLNLSNPDEVIGMLRKMARLHDIREYRM